MVAFTTVVSHILARFQVYISCKALLASTLRADIAVGSTGMIALQNKSYIIFIFLKFNDKNVSECIISALIQNNH